MDRSNIYMGETRNMLRNGFGTFCYENKYFKYEGEWIDGRKHGHGRLLMSDGGYYEGQFTTGEISGKGERFWGTTKNFYRGDFKNGELNGYGKMSYGNGDVYEGQWDFNMRQGQGVLITKSGDRYEGEFHKHQRHGEGIAYYSDGNVYSGYWICGKRHGHGTLTFMDGSEYKGQFNYDNFHGEGTLTHRSGMVISGIWDQGKPSMLPSQIKLNNVNLECTQGNNFNVSISVVNDAGEVVEEESGRSLRVSAGVKYSPAAETNSLFMIIEQLQIQSIETPLYPVVLVPLNVKYPNPPGTYADTGSATELICQYSGENSDPLLLVTKRGLCDWNELSIGRLEVMPTECSNVTMTEPTKTTTFDLPLTDEEALRKSRNEEDLFPNTGEYLLMIEDVTERPYLDVRLNTLYVTMQVLPRRKIDSSKSKEGTKQRKSQDSKEKSGRESAEVLRGNV